MLCGTTTSTGAIVQTAAAAAAAAALAAALATVTAEAMAVATVKTEGETPGMSRARIEYRLHTAGGILRLIREVAVQLLSTEEWLKHEMLLIQYMRLGADGAPGDATALRVESSWTVSDLLDVISTMTAIPRARLAVAKPRASAKGITAKQIGSLAWDDPKV